MRNFLLWIDSVGSYLVCSGEVVTLGRPGEEITDIPIMGDLSPRHARIRRNGESYLIEAIRDVSVDGHTVQPVRSLTDSARLQLGPSVKMAFRRPHALSRTARLDFLSPHRTEPSVNGVILLAESCVLGPKSHSHIVCRGWTQEVVLFRQENDLFCRTGNAMEIDGEACRQRGRLRMESYVCGDGFSFKVEQVR